MTTNVAIIGLGIMGTRMLQHMRKHEEFNPNYLWDPNPIACEKAIKQDSESLSKLEHERKSIWFYSLSLGTSSLTCTI